MGGSIHFLKKGGRGFYSFSQKGESDPLIFLQREEGSIHFLEKGDGGNPFILLKGGGHPFMLLKRQEGYSHSLQGERADPLIFQMGGG